VSEEPLEAEATEVRQIVSKLVDRLCWLRCERCLKRKYCIPSPGWPVCHGEVMSRV